MGVVVAPDSDGVGVAEEVASGRVGVAEEVDSGRVEVAAAALDSKVTSHRLEVVMQKKEEAI